MPLGANSEEPDELDMMLTGAFGPSEEFPDVNPFDDFVTDIQNLNGTPAQKMRKIRALLETMEVPEQEYAPAELWDTFLKENPDDSYDYLWDGGLERGERVICVAAEGVGKLLTLSEPIPTPSGWTTMGDLRIGDQVFDRFGVPCSVVFVSEVAQSPESAWMEFSDGTRIKACVDHQWLTIDYKSRQRNKVADCRQWQTQIHTTAQIRDTLMARDGHCLNHAIPVTGILEYPTKQLPVDPYLLGYWLGNGGSKTNELHYHLDDDAELRNLLPMEDNRGHNNSGKATVPGLKSGMKALGTYGAKHIPREYLESDPSQRLALLQGLLDSDGYCPLETGEGRGHGATSIELCFTNERLALDAHELILSLGHVCSFAEAEAAYTKNGVKHITGTRYRMIFQTELPVFRLSRKLSRLSPLKTQRSKLRYVTNVVVAEPEPMRCIQVDSPDNSYLASRAMVPTHNTVLMRQVAICLAAGLHPFTGKTIDPLVTLTVDCENPKKIIQRNSRRIMKLAKERSYCDVKAYLRRIPMGVNLLKAPGRKMIEQLVAEVRPDILFMGPLYKCFIDPGGRSSESVATEIAMFYDYLREEYDCALWLEQHAPLGNGVSGREMRPFGSAVWSRWPEFGITISKDPTDPRTYKFGVFRGMRDDREFPETAHRGGPLDFPFVVDSFMSH